MQLFPEYQLESGKIDHIDILRWIVMFDRWVDENAGGVPDKIWGNVKMTLPGMDISLGAPSFILREMSIYSYLRAMGRFILANHTRPASYIRCENDGLRAVRRLLEIAHDIRASNLDNLVALFLTGLIDKANI